MTIITPVNIKKIPQEIFKVMVSPNKITPKNNAVNGSKAPSIAVGVAPISFTAVVTVSIESMVGKIASNKAQQVTK